MNNRVLSALLCISLLFSFASVAGAKSSNVKNVYVDTVKEQQEETEQGNTEPQQSAEEETAEKDIDTEAPKEYVLSLDDAINMAVTDNPQFINYDTAIEDAEVQLNKAKKTMRDTEKVVPKLPAGIETVAVQKGYYVEQAQINLDSKKMEKQQAESKLAYNVTEQYYNVKLTEALLACTKDAYDMALTNKNTIDTRFELGLVAELDVKNAELALDEVKSSYDSCKRGLELAILNLKISLQIEDTDCKLTLTDGIDFEDFTSDAAADAEKAIESRYDMYQLKKARDQAIAYRNITSILGESSSYYSAANKSVSQTEYMYTNTSKLRKLGIKSNYNDIVTAKSNLEIASRKAALAQQEYEIAKLKYELGLITNSELTSKMNSISSALKDVENAKLTYKLAVKKYGYEISIGL